MSAVLEDTRPRAAPDETLGLVRETVRTLLMSSPAFQQLDPQRQREMAQAMVKVCHTAASLIREEMETCEAIRPASTSPPALSPAGGQKLFPTALASNKSHAGSPLAPRPRLARAQSAGSQFSGVAADRVAGTTHAILNAVSFPRFVAELINGVFRAIIDSSQQQMQAYVELLGNVAATTTGFADTALSNNRARVWLAERYPASFEIGAEEDDWGQEPGEPPPERRLQLRSGASLPTEAALRTDLGIPEDQPIPTGDPDGALVPFARIALARQKQQMLATLVMLGLQRIVIESGRINASMRFHIDTRSAAAGDEGSRFEMQNEIAASGSFGVGPWGASASARNSIGYVSTQRTQTTEEMNTDLDLNSSVELNFKSDYVPLNRLAGETQQERIRANTLNPDAEAKVSADARAAREKRYGEGEKARRESVDTSLAPTQKLPSLPPLPEKKKEPSAAPVSPPAAAPPAAAPPAAAPPAAAPPAAAPPAAAPPAARGAARTASALVLSTPREGPQRLPGNPSQRKPDVIFIPSRDQAVLEMLRLANVQPGELLYDLGCGDGRIVVLAAELFGSRAIGFDIDPERIAEARANVQRHQVSDLVSIVHQDLFTVDLSRADVVALYLLPKLNVKLIPQFNKMKPGSRIVSQDFDMAGVIPDRVVQVHFKEENVYKTFYLWTTPLRKEQSKVPHEWAEAQELAPQSHKRSATNQ